MNEFLPPSEILTQFIDAIVEGSERQKQRLKELELVRRLVKSISEYISGKKSIRKRAKETKVRNTEGFSIQ